MYKRYFLSFIIKHRLICLVIFSLLFSLNSWSQNDTLVLNNNDKIIGEIKQMDRGVLTIETDYSDADFKVKWKDVIKINSDQIYLLTLSNGRRLNSTLNTKSGDSSKVTLQSGSETITTKIKSVVFIKPVENKFISRFTASLSVGFNYTKSNNLTQFTVRSSLSYTAYKWLFNGSFNSVRSSQDDIDDTQRTDATLGIKYFMKNDWFYSGSGDFLSNDEQKLKLRSTWAAGFGKYIVHSNRLNFGAGAGLAYTNEKFTDDDNTNRNSLEIYGGLSLDIFDFDDLSLTTNITAYPSLTEKGRIRYDYSLDVKYDLPLDFFLKVGLTYNYDSKPIEGASTIDYVLQATFGWDFNN